MKLLKDDIKKRTTKVQIIPKTRKVNQKQ